MCCYRKTRTSGIAEHTRALLVPGKLQSHCWRNDGWSLALGRGTIMYSSCRCKASKETKQSLGKCCKNSQQTLTWWRQGCVHLVDPNNIYIYHFFGPALIRSFFYFVTEMCLMWAVTKWKCLWSGGRQRSQHLCLLILQLLQYSVITSSITATSPERQFRCSASCLWRL